MAGLALTTPQPATADNLAFAEMADRARGLARDISRNVGRILGALQIGDISRQRAQHVQSGLTLLEGLDQSANQVKLRAAGELLLEAQFEAALRDYSHEVTKLLPSIEGLAADALALSALSDTVAELGDGGQELRDLKFRMDAAVQLVAEIQAADGATRYLAGCLKSDKGPIVGADASAPTLERHPLDQKAGDLLDRVVYLEAAADDCVVILERLKEASDALITEHPATVHTADMPLGSQKGLTGAAEKIRAILGKAEDDMAAHAGKSTDILRLLDCAAGQTISDDAHEADRCGGLNFSAPERDADGEAFRQDLSVFLSQIEGLYAMGQEREVHRAFSKACGLAVAEAHEEIDDGLF